MSIEAASEAYGALVTWLRNSNLGWVADQIEDEIVLGKIKTERISVPFESPRQLFDPQSTKSSSAEFLTRVEYTSYEKYDIAAGAVRAVVVGAIKMQESLISTLNVHDETIHFVPGETGEITHSLESSSLVVDVSKIEQIERHLAELTDGVKNDLKTDTAR